MSGSNSIELTAKAILPTQYGDFQLQSYREKLLKKEGENISSISSKDFNNSKEPILCLTLGLQTNKIPLVRVHSECITGEVFGSLRCECSQQLDLSMAKIAEHGCGIIVYLRQEGRGIGIENKIKAYALQDLGLDTVDANIELGLPVDSRDFSPAATILKKLGIKNCMLLTNNPEKMEALKFAGILVDQSIALLANNKHPSCVQYLATKKAKLGHYL